jgi:hypothetical protein
LLLRIERGEHRQRPSGFNLESAAVLPETQPDDHLGGGRCAALFGQELRDHELGPPHDRCGHPPAEDLTDYAPRLGRRA